MSEELAKKAYQAYQAYGETTNFKNYLDLPIHDWENLPDTIKKAWCNTASGIAD